MPKINEVTIEGKLCRPEMKHTKTGKPFYRASIKFNNRKDEETGIWDSSFLPVKAFKDTALNLDTVKPEGPVIVKGWLNEEKWTGKDEKRHSRMTLMLKEVNFLENKPGQASGTDEPCPF